MNELQDGILTETFFTIVSIILSFLMKIFFYNGK